jgi:FtsP/CotA-like multicopper oxidase with cupredoxin domain
LNHKWILGVQPMRREYRWTITDEEVNPDGVYRQMILINGQFPGPMIECNEGDTLSIEIDNQSVNATAFHWHGIYQNGSNWMDGTVEVTQCPIAPGGKFTYEFTITGQSGTYW